MPCTPETYATPFVVLHYDDKEERTILLPIEQSYWESVETVESLVQGAFCPLDQPNAPGLWITIYEDQEPNLFEVQPLKLSPHLATFERFGNGNGFILEFPTLTFGYAECCWWTNEQWEECVGVSVETPIEERGQ